MKKTSRKPSVRRFSFGTPASRSLFVVVPALVIASALAACGSSTSPTGSGIEAEPVDTTAIEEPTTQAPPATDEIVMAAFEWQEDIDQPDPAKVDMEIWTVDGDGSNLRKLTDNQVNDDNPLWSPDRTRVIFRRWDNTAEIETRPELWVMDSDGNNQRLLSEGLDVGGELLPYSWSPDGNFIVTEGYRPGIDLENDSIGGIYLVDSDMGQATPLADTQESDLWPSLSPDGSHIAFVKSGETSFDLYVVDVDGSNLTRLAEGFDVRSSPMWTPDGGTLIFGSLINEELRILSLDIAANTVTSLNNYQVWWPSLSPDGTKIAYWADTEIPEVWVMNVDGSSPTLIANPAQDFDAVTQFSPDLSLAWSPDSSRIIFSFTTSPGEVDPNSMAPIELFTHVWIADTTGTNPPIKVIRGDGPLAGSVMAHWAS